jgi:hypothetical protein
MVFCPVEEGCCGYSNTSTSSPTPTLQHSPTGQLILKEYSQRIGVTTLMISALSMASAVAVLVIIALARHVQTEARNIFLDSVYGEKDSLLG